MALPVMLPGSPGLSSDEQVLSSNSGSAEDHPHAPSGSGGGASGSASGDMGEENERLRLKNARLTRELGQMKKLFNNILLLMSKHAASQQLDASAALSSVVNNSGESLEALPRPPPLPPAIIEPRAPRPWPPRPPRSLTQLPGCSASPSGRSGCVKTKAASTRSRRTTAARERSRSCWIRISIRVARSHCPTSTAGPYTGPRLCTTRRGPATGPTRTGPACTSFYCCID
jgi:hypothetical protein